MDNKSGTYELAIKDQKEGSVTYHFNVVDDYYLPDEQFISADYNVLPNGAVYLDFEIGDLTGLEAVYLDSGETPFIVDGNILKVYYEAQSSFSIETLELVKIVKSGVEIEVHKQFSVKTLRHTPHLAIKEQESMSPAFVIKVDDPDQSIRSIELQMGDVKLFNFLQNEAMNLGDIKNKDLPLYVYINYDLGDGIIQRKKVLYLDAKYQNGEVLSLNYQFVGSKMDTINLDVNLKSIKELRQLSVNSENLALNYQTAVNYQNVWISVMISGMVIILIIIYLVIRKRQRGRFDYLKK